MPINTLEIEKHQPPRKASDPLILIVLLTSVYIYWLYRRCISSLADIQI